MMSANSVFYIICNLKFHFLVLAELIQYLSNWAMQVKYTTSECPNKNFVDSCCDLLALVVLRHKHFSFCRTLCMKLIHATAT